MWNYNRCRQWVQNFLDRSVPYPVERWIMLLVLSSYTLYRIVMKEFLAILFLWGLYVLYLLVQFYTPSGLPDPDDDLFGAEPSLQEQIPLEIFEQFVEAGEDRPLLRTINQFNLWKNILTAVMFSWIGTLSDLFKLPVYWPFLLIYFAYLIILAIRKHLRHMKKYRYSSIDFLKKKNSYPNSEKGCFDQNII